MFDEINFNLKSHCAFKMKIKVIFKWKMNCILMRHGFDIYTKFIYTDTDYLYKLNCTS